MGSEEGEDKKEVKKMASEAQDYYIRGLTLAAEEKWSDQQIHFLSKAIKAELTLADEVIVHLLLTECYAQKRNLEMAQQEIFLARKALGVLIGLKGEELDQFITKYTDWFLEPSHKNEKRWSAFVHAITKDKPWYLILSEVTFVDQKHLKEGVDMLDFWKDYEFPKSNEFLHFILGHHYFEHGEIEQGIAEFKKGIQDRRYWHRYDPQGGAPRHCSAFRTILGLMYKEKGDLKKAIKEWQTVLEIEGVDDEITRYWLEKAKVLKTEIEQEIKKPRREEEPKKKGFFKKLFG